MLGAISLAIVALSVILSTFSVQGRTVFQQRAQEDFPLVSCSNLVLEKKEIAVGEKVKISAEVSNFGIVRYGRVEKIGDRVVDSASPLSLFEGKNQFEGIFQATQSGIYAFEVNAYDDENCGYLCSAGKIVYKRTAEAEEPKLNCTARGIWQSVGSCESTGCIAWLKVIEETIKPTVAAKPTPTGVPTAVPTAIPTKHVAVSLTPTAVPTIKVTPKVDLSVDDENSYCYYIPSSLYGAPAEKWEEYICSNGQWVLKKALSGELDSLTGQKEDLQVENIQAPSVKNFTSFVQTGDAVVSYPIEVPPAPAGFAPSLSLNYSSGAVEDMKIISDPEIKTERWQSIFKGKFNKQGSYLGLGWNLSGIPQIIRNSGRKYNLVLAGHSYELIFDGERTGGSGEDYEGEDAFKRAYYKTNPENFIKIVRGEVSENELKQSVDWDIRPWDIWTKDGTHYHFEKQGFVITREHFKELCNSGTNIKFKNRRDYYKWAIIESTDASGNKIKYSYDVSETKSVEGDCNGCGSPCWGIDLRDKKPIYPRAIYPTEIHYGKDLQNKIVFGYADRDDWQIKDFDDGNKFVNFYGKKRLSSIEVSLGNTKLRTYEIVPDYTAENTNDETEYLILASIKLKAEGGSEFPASQSFAYFDEENPDYFGQLSKASNGYGGTVEYVYERGDDINPGYYDGGKYKYTGPDHTFKRNRLKYKIVKSNFNSNQKQKTQYFYPYDKGQDPYCQSDGDNCFNARATYWNPYWVDFEFLGYHFVKEENYHTENGAIDNSTDGWVKDPSTFYVFHQSEQSNDSRSFTPFLYRGTLAKKVLLDKNDQVLSIEENNYKVSSGSHPFVYLAEAKTCSDLDVSESSLRRASYSKSEETDFDSHGNPIYQRTYPIDSCSKKGDNFYNYQVDLPLDLSVYRKTKTVYLNRKIVGNDLYFSSRPVLAEVQDSGGKPLSLNLMFYDDKGRLTQTFAVDGKNLANKEAKAIKNETAYDDYGNISATTSYADYAKLVNLAPEGVWWKFDISSYPTDSRKTVTQYDSRFAAFPKKVINPLGHSIETIYDFEIGGTNILGLPVKVIDPNNQATLMAYDNFGRIMAKALPGDTLAGPTAKYTYFDNQQGLTYTPFAFKTEIKDRKESGQLVYLSSWVFYDDWGRKLQTQSEGLVKGQMFSDFTVYDGLGRVTESVLSQIVWNQGQVYFDFREQVYSGRKVGDFVTKNTYDSQGRVVRVKSADGTCSLTRYEGKRTASFDPQKTKSAIEVDSLGRQTLVYSYQNPFSQVLGSSTSSFLDKIISFFSKLVKGETSLKRALRGLDCDSKSVVYPDEGAVYNLYTSSKQDYDVLDQPTVLTVNKGADLLLRSTTEYDGFSRPFLSQDPDLGKTEVTEYDGLGNQLKVKDNAGQVKSFVYDKLSRLTDICWGEICSSGSGTIGRLVYDSPRDLNSKGRLSAEISPNILEKNFKYNPRGQVYSTTYKLLDENNSFIGKDTIEYYTFYDIAGRPVTTTINGPRANQAWVNQLIDDTRYLYDNTGRLRETYFGHSEKNSAGSFTTLNNREYFVKDIKYNWFGAVEEQTLGNSTTETFKYNQEDKSLRLKEHSVSNDLLSLNYDYSPAGNIEKLTDKAAGKAYQYTYDSFYRLRSVSGAINASYSYDELSRMTTKNEREELTFGFNSQTPLHAPKNYTLNGQTKDLSYKGSNLKTLAGGNQLFYDQDNRISEVKNSKGETIAKYTYDFKGQRIKTVEGSKTTYSHLPGIEIEIKEGQIIFRDYFSGGGMQKLVYNSDPTAENAVPVTNEIFQVYTDHLSSTKVIADKNGNKISGGEIDYYPYGSQKQGGGAASLPTNRLYTGQINDADTGLYYYNARYYDPYLGMFTSADKAQGPNRFAYVGGNPIMRNDPSGLAAAYDPGAGSGVPLTPWEEFWKNLSNNPVGMLTGAWDVIRPNPDDPVNKAITDWWVAVRQQDPATQVALIAGAPIMVAASVGGAVWLNNPGAVSSWAQGQLSSSTSGLVSAVSYDPAWWTTGDPRGLSSGYTSSSVGPRPAGGLPNTVDESIEYVRQRDYWAASNIRKTSELNMGSCDPYTGEIKIGMRASPRTVFHEWGHYVWNNSPSKARLANTLGRNLNYEPVGGDPWNEFAAEAKVQQVLLEANANPNTYGSLNIYKYLLDLIK